MNPEVQHWIAFAAVGGLLLASAALASFVSKRFGD